MTVALVLVLACEAGPGNAFQGTVVRCGDGDSLTVRSESGALHEIRLFGVDCPELHQEYGPDALTATEEFSLNSQVEVLSMEMDQYGRLISLVILADGSVLNRELVREGHAWVYSRHCDKDFCGEWDADQMAAQAQGLGLWRAYDPMPPWQWRYENGNRN
ncbi:MAG: thermonuclease family protein [Desulfovibrio sp.]|nr:MAG: thermonuclease family protein [Desulfovibrio sp.]